MNTDQPMNRHSNDFNSKSISTSTLTSTIGFKVICPAILALQTDFPNVDFFIKFRKCQCKYTVNYFATIKCRRNSRITTTCVFKSIK